MLKNNEKGTGYAIILILLMLMIAVAPVAVIAMTTEGKHSKQYNDSFQAYYYAKSGIEMTISLLEKDPKKYLKEDGFLLYGTVETGLKNSIDHNEYFKNKGEEDFENEDIFVKVEVQWDSDSKKGKGKIISTGTYQGDKKKIIRDFSFSSEGSGSDNETITAEELFNFDGDEFYELIKDVNNPHNRWYKNIGQVVNKERYKNKPVIWSNESNGNIIYDDNQSVFATFTAPIMYFKDKIKYYQKKSSNNTINGSLLIKDNATKLTLESNFIWFEENIIFEYKSNNDKNIGKLTLKTFKAKEGSSGDKSLESGLTGNDIAQKLGVEIAEEDKNKKYGLIYIGNDIILFDTKNSQKDGEATLSGFYYFPEGISLYWNVIEKKDENNVIKEIILPEKNKLIPVNFGDIDFEKLKIKKWLNNTGNNDKIEFGKYQ